MDPKVEDLIPDIEKVYKREARVRMFQTIMKCVTLVYIVKLLFKR